jgi:hypothetical protein
MNIKSSRKSFSLILVTVLVVMMSGQNALAAPVSIDLVDFSGSENVIDFNGIANEEPIAEQFSNMCVSFSGAIFGMTNSGDTSQFPNNGGGVIASNWIYGGGGLQGTSFTVSLGSTFTKVGFYAETNSEDDTTIEVSLNSTSGGSISFNTTVSAPFIGVEDVSGFDSITVSVSGNSNQFLAIDDLRFEGGTLCNGNTPVITNTVPVPLLSLSSIFVLISGLLGLGLFTLRRRFH